MRAQCEGCGKFQSPDWKAGDLCSFCGKAVRHDVRCYWCAKWVPAAKFCRSCGAAVVEETLYGAARMLKDAGTDRFTIPKQLKDFDPEQIENFSRIYQRHAIAVARHVDEVRFLERFLRQKHWSGELDDELVPQLPWNEETLGVMSAPAHPAGDDLATAKLIQEKSPFGTTQELARIVRLRLDDWSAHREVCSTFYTRHPALRAEAALALTSWRVWSSCGYQRDLNRDLVAELEKSAFKVEAAVGLGLLGVEKKDLLREALTSPDPIVAFGAAIVTGDAERLQAGLQGDELQKIAAGRKLVALGIIKPVVQTVEKSPLEVQQELVEALTRRKGPAPEASDTLLEIVETTPDKTLRERAARILCRQIRPAWVLRIAKAAKEDRSIYQSLLQAEGLTSDAAQELGDFLIGNGHFSMHQYGMSTVAEKGIMPETFVSTRFARADAETQGELLRFAETQLEHGKSEAIHKFVMGVVFGAHPAKIRAGAWWVLHRWYRQQGEYRGEGPFKLEVSVIKRFFGSVGAFVPKLAAVLRDHDTMKEVGYFEMMANVLGSADDATITAIQKDASAADDLVDALIGAMTGDYWPNTVEGMFKLLSRIGGHPRWRTKALEALRSLNRRGNYYYDKALRSLELSEYGIPEENEWDALPLNFVPTRIEKADAAGRLELLKVAEHQLIHKKTDQPDAKLLKMLLDLALTPGGTDVRLRAMEIHHERARDRHFPLKKKDVTQAYGPFGEFVELLAGALRDAATLDAPPLLEFLARVFDNPEPEDAELIAGEKKKGRELIDAMLEIASASGRGDELLRLRRDVVRHLECSGNHDAWRDEVIAALDRIQGKAKSDLKDDCERTLRAIRPPEPDRPELDDAPREPAPKGRPPRKLKPEKAPEDPWMAKQKIAERMGQELQQAIMKLMAGSKSPEEKMKEATRMSEEYQAKIKDLYK